MLEELLFEISVLSVFFFDFFRKDQNEVDSKVTPFSIHGPYDDILLLLHLRAFRLPFSVGPSLLDSGNQFVFLPAG